MTGQTLIHRLAIAVAALLVGAGAVLADGFGPLVTPAELAEGRDAVQPVVLDIRDQGYAEGHLPGAVSAPYSTFRGPRDNAGQVPRIDKLQSDLEKFGLATDRPVVIVPDGRTDSDFGAAARVYWTLKSVGFENLSILNGGTQGWVAAGLPVDTTQVMPQPTTLDLTFSDQWLAPTGTVTDIIDGRIDAVLVDSRPAEFFEGRAKVDAAAKPGTLPGAESHPYTNFFTPGSAAISPVQDAADLKRRLGVADGQDVVAFCNTGHWAATEWFALSELAGIENVRLYPTSMVEYSQTGLPMDNVPSLLASLKRQIRGD
ncbi:MAG: rhodanese-like domain-containing protein [Paracoccus sp. (in: a-proteobacteria)]|nr:rhodanese-like domain-containing protein [Paracoccus sp. (in: a-proteobacteria)]